MNIGPVVVISIQNNAEALEKVQRKATKLISRLEAKPHDEQLKKLGMYNLMETKIRVK